MELSQDKTLITHARTGAARFLGYDITVQHNDRRITGGRRSANANIALRVPRTVIQAKRPRYMRRGKPAHRTQLLNATDYDIVATYGAEYRGIVQYYLLAVNIRVFNRLRWVMLTSLLKTLAMKHRSTVTTMARKHQTKIVTPSGPRVCFEAIVQREGRKSLVARFGGIPLKRQRSAVLHDRLPGRERYPRRELITRLLNGKCELCEHVGEVQGHHIRRLADLNPSSPTQPTWARIMAKRRRKTLVVCADCHDRIHTGHRATE